MSGVSYLGGGQTKGMINGKKIDACGMALRVSCFTVISVCFEDLIGFHSSLSLMIPNR